MIDAAQLLARVGADTSDAEAKIAGFSDRLAGISNDFAGALLKHDLVRLAADALTNFAKTAVDSYAENERLGQSLDTLVARELRQRDTSLSMADALAQAAPKAQELIQWNQQLAINSPFTEAGVAATFRMAEAYGFVSDSADKTAITAKRLTQDIIDFTAGSGRSEETANRVALALGQIQARGTLAGQEVRQLTEAGVAVDQVLASAFHKSTDEIVALREKGAIPADAAIRAIVQSLESDFGGAAQRQAGTVGGLINSLQDLERIASRDLLGPVFQAAQPFVQDLVTTLQAPETRQSLQEIGVSLGTIARDDLPVIVSDMHDFAGYTKEVYDAIKPVVDAYHAIEQIKLPGGAEVGDMIGLKPIQEFATGGAYRDVLKFYNDLTGATAQAATGVDGLNKAFGGGGGGSGWGPSLDNATTSTQALTGAQQQLDLQLGISDEQRKKYNDQLTKTGTAGDEAYQRLQDSQRQFQAQEADRLRDHQERLSGIEDAAQQRRVAAAAQYHDRLATIEQAHTDKLADMQRAADAKHTEAEQREQERQTQAAEQMNQKLADIQERAGELADSYQQQRQDRARDHQEKLADITRSGAQKTAEAEQQYLNQREQAEEAYNDRVADLNQQLADLQEQSAEQAEDRQRALADRLGDLQSQLADRLRGIQEQYSEHQQDATERYDTDRRNKTQDHQDKLRDLQERLGEATTDAQRAAIQRQIDQENERYTKQEERAREAYQRAQQEAAEDLARQIAHAQEQEQRQEQAAQEQAAREEERAAEQLARQEQHLAEQQAALDRDYQQKQERQQQQYAREKTAREAALAEQVADEAQSYARSRQAAQQKYDHDLALLAEQAAKERASYAEREADAQHHYAETLAEQAATLTQQVADENRAYERQRADLFHHYAEQRHQQDAELARRLEEENKNFTRQEADARKSYGQQQADLREALGKQLDAYTTTQEQLTQITAAEATRRRAIIAAELGYDPGAAQAEFGRILAQLLGSGGGSVGGGSAIHSEASGLNINGDVHINIPNANVQNPAQFAQQVRSELIRMGQQNRGLSGGVLGGY
jgi:tape measure domain-containing protein